MLQHKEQQVKSDAARIADLEANEKALRQSIDKLERELHNSVVCRPIWRKTFPSSGETILSCDETHSPHLAIRSLHVANNQCHEMKHNPCIWQNVPIV